MRKLIIFAFMFSMTFSFFAHPAGLNNVSGSQNNMISDRDTITSYFDHDWKKCDRKFAVYYRKAYLDSSYMWIVEDYHMNGQLQMTGNFSDKKLKKKQGTFIYYHHNGKVSLLEQYSDNKPVGIWKSYYTCGNIALEGQMSNSRRIGTWTYYHINGTVLAKENFVKGKREGEVSWYYESGKICEKATYKRGKMKSKINYDEHGNMVTKIEENREPEFPGGNDNLIAFLQKTLEYPEELLLKGKEDRIVFSFIVRKDGSIDHIEYLLKSDEPLFNQEAFRVFSLVKYMNPAYIHGQIIDRECIFPITFRLQR